MGDNKPPAYQWYPQDHLSNAHVLQMTLEQEGAYRRLMDHCWLAGSIPLSVPELARLCRITPGRMEKIWTVIEPRFNRKGEGYVQPRLEKERKKYAMHKKAKSEAGKEGAKARWQKEENGCALELPLTKNGSSLSPSLSTSILQTCTFEDFWKAYPKRKGSNPKRPAKAKWDKVVKQVHPNELLRCVESFAKRCSANGETNTQYVPMTKTWLNQARWEEERDGDGKRRDEEPGALHRPLLRNWSPTDD